MLEIKNIYKTFNPGTINEKGSLKRSFPEASMKVISLTVIRRQTEPENPQC